MARITLFTSTHTLHFACQALEEALPALLRSLSFGKSMRWLPGGAAFSRPVRWTLALHGSSPLRFSFADTDSGTSTRLLRSAEEPTVEVRERRRLSGVDRREISPDGGLVMLST